MGDMLQTYMNSRTGVNNMFDVFLFVLLVVGMWKMFEKAGQPGWMGLVPFLNIYKVFEIAWGNGLFFLLLFIPIVNIVVLGYLSLYLARAYGKSDYFAIGLFLLTPIFYTVLGLGDAVYYGPKGMAAQTGSGRTYGSRGTSDTVNFNVRKSEREDGCRDAKTVDFDVQKNDK